MHVACGMEMSISLKLCGAEVYVCNEGEMKCSFGRGTKPTRTNVARMERIYRKHNDNSTRNVFIFLQQLLGGGEIEEMHEVFNNLQAAERSLATVPIFENLLCFFNCYPK